MKTFKGVARLHRMSIMLLHALVLTALLVATHAWGDGMSPQALAYANRLQAQLDRQGTHSAPPGVAWFRIVHGCAPVIITAPHATKPFRNGKLRYADGGGTAALALALHASTGATVIYTTYASPSDPNYYDDNDFKRALEKIITREHPRLVLDLHASGPRRPYDIDLGTMHGASLLGHEILRDELDTSLKANGVVRVSHDFFSAQKQKTITKFASRLGAPAIQLEVNKRWYVLDNDPDRNRRFAMLMQGLTSFIETALEDLHCVEADAALR
ncbi:hypothetical protein [Caballeronia sp. S22]|uniref:hypothetical protein n=1 Tax=Caballeronia sp. S22 TaxID=3137182 RepID=UPI003531074C